MIPPKHSALHKKLLLGYVNRQLNKHFHAINYFGEIKHAQKSMLVIGNHISWWDGFWLLKLNQEKWKKQFHVMMLEEELKKRMFFNKCGAYSINPGNISVRQSFITTLNLLNKPQNMVLFYPEGEIKSATQYPKKLMPGIEHVLKKLAPEASIMLQASFTDYFSNKKPTLNLYFQQITDQLPRSVTELENKYNAFYNDCMVQQQDYAKKQL